MLDNYPVKKLDKDEFPRGLSHIPSPPKQLRIRGELPSPKSKYLCVIGSRKYTPYGKSVCEKLISGLRGFDIVIVSGLALGIDGIAHESAIQAGLKTIAVPGSGLGSKVIYPRSNIGLAERILENGGCLLSEFDDEFRATIYSFPQRNRIEAGMADAVLIIEAGEKSGTLITARLAVDYNRDVLTVPGDIFRETSGGPALLLKLGATPITKSEDILEALHIKVEPGKQKALFYPDVNEKEALVIGLLHSSPKSRDELIVESNLESQELSQILTLLELKGYIKESLGKVLLI